MVVVTHEMGFAREVGDRVVLWMRDNFGGGHPEEIFTHPQHERTRSFLRKIISHNQ